MKLYHTLMVALVFALAGCHSPSTYDSDTDDSPTVVPVAPVAPLPPPPKPIVTHNLLRSSYRIRAHFQADGIDRFVAGTGTGIDARHILTVAHCVCAAIMHHPEIEADFIRVDVFNDDAVYDYSIPAHVMRINVHEDVAELETTENLPFFHALDYGEFSGGKPCYNIGAADGGIPFQIFHGRMSKRDIEMDALDAKEPHVFLFELNYPVHGGTSGGGVYTYVGKFIGIIDRGDMDTTWIVKHDVIRAFLEGK